MSQYSRRAVVLAVCGAAVLTSGAWDAEAALILGRVKAPAKTIPTRTLGYTKTRIAATAASLRNRKQEVALYLKVKKSLPIPAHNGRREVAIRGRMFRPSVMPCLYDDSVIIRNEDRVSMTVVVGDEKLGVIQPSQEAKYECKVSGFHEIRVQEFQYIRGTVFVGEVGVAAQPGADGSFTLSAPAGTYELQVIGPGSVLERADVVVEKVNVELGLVGAEQPLAATPHATEPEPEPEPAPVVIPPPPPPEPVAKPTPKRKPRPAAKPKPKPRPKTASKPPPPPPPPKAAPKPKPAPEKAKPKKEEAPVDDFFEMEL